MRKKYQDDFKRYFYEMNSVEILHLAEACIRQISPTIERVDGIVMTEDDIRDAAAIATSDLLSVREDMKAEDEDATHDAPEQAVN